MSKEEIYEILYEMRLAPRHQLELAAIKIEHAIVTQADANKAAEEGARHPWFCAHCQTGVPSVNVTFEEEHDPRAGGCGYRVGDWPAAAEEGGLPTSDFQWRKKHVVIEAIQWPGCRFPETPPQWFIDAMHKKPGKPGFLMRMDDDIFIETLEGRMRAEPGDWIIRGIAGEIYPCKPKIFEGSYERVDRASRQVANKAEVEQTCVCGSPTTIGSVHRTDGPCYVAETTPPANKAEVEVNEFAMAIYDISLMLGLPRGATPTDVCLAVDRLATPPATTGGANATPTGASTAAGDWYDAADGVEITTREYGNGIFFTTDCARPSSVGASTVLTDDLQAQVDKWHKRACDEREKNVLLETQVRMYEAEVAAQAGQVAVLNEDEIEWSHDVQTRLRNAVLGDGEDEGDRQVMAEAACLLAALTGSAPSPAKESK